jgi:hypothetical protein
MFFVGRDFSRDIQWRANGALAPEVLSSLNSGPFMRCLGSADILRDISAFFFAAPRLL